MTFLLLYLKNEAMINHPPPLFRVGDKKNNAQSTWGGGVFMRRVIKVLLSRKKWETDLMKRSDDHPEKIGSRLEYMVVEKGTFTNLTDA